MTEKGEKDLEQIVRKDGRYPLEAFAFLHEGLARAVKQIYGDQADQPPPDAGPGPEKPVRRPRHVSGAQLCRALRDEAIERWGLLAKSVLQRWNIRATIDFGNMVYLLIDSGLMDKTEQDSIEDFRDVYDFSAAFAPKTVFEADAES